MTMYEHICVICGKPFTSARPDSKCCSRECKYEKAKEYAKAERKVHKEKTCPVCGTIFTASSPERKYCSMVCARRHANEVRREKRNPKVKDADIREIVRRANEMGVSYGEYVARWGK